MSTPLELEPGATSAQPESVLQGEKRIEGRSLGQIAWTRLKRDKVALAGGFFVVYLIVVAICAPLIVGLLGHPPNEFHQDLIDPNTQIPIGAVRRHVLGLPLRRSSRSTAATSSAASSTARRSPCSSPSSRPCSPWSSARPSASSPASSAAAIDTIISRTMDVFLAFPLLVFALALAGVVPDEAFGLQGRRAAHRRSSSSSSASSTGPTSAASSAARRCRCASASSSTPRAASARARRTSCSRSCCPTSWRRSSSTRRCSSRPTSSSRRPCPSSASASSRPRATWGGMLSDAAQWYQIDPWFMLWPGLAIFVTVLAFNLFGDGLRDALDPRSR